MTYKRLTHVTYITYALRKNIKTPITENNRILLKGLCYNNGPHLRKESKTEKWTYSRFNVKLGSL